MGFLPKHPGFLASILALLAGGIWLFTGRLSWFETSNYTETLYSSNVLRLAAEGEIRQDFISNYPGLSRVDIFVATSKATAEPAEIILHLREKCESGSDLRQASVTQPGGEIDGRAFYAFNFPPIEESAQQKFCFILEAKPSGAENQGVGVLASLVDVYPNGRIFYTPPLASSSEQPNPLFEHRLYLPLLQKIETGYEQIDANFQLHYWGQPLATLQVFLARLVMYKPYVFGQVGFYGVLFVLYLSSVIYLIRLTFYHLKNTID